MEKHGEPDVMAHFNISDDDWDTAPDAIQIALMESFGAVNAHADLVAALERCIADGDLPLGVDSQARAALRKAKGEA